MRSKASLFLHFSPCDYNNDDDYDDDNNEYDYYYYSNLFVLKRSYHIYIGIRAF